MLKDLEVQDIPKFDSIIVLTEQNEDQVALNCDSRTLVTTLLIRDIQKRSGVKHTLCAEILDPRTEKLMKLSKLDDYISSNDLVSMRLARLHRSPTSTASSRTFSAQ